LNDLPRKAMSAIGTSSLMNVKYIDILQGYDPFFTSFSANLHFWENSYRTTPLNSALALILQRNKGLQNEKTGQILFEESLSAELPVAGLEPTPGYPEQILSLPRLPFHHTGEVLWIKSN
jgi:hypothetical protein